MSIIDRLDAARRASNVLEHPFYQRWSAGEMTEAELALYVGQYRHAVVALADASDALADTATDGSAAGLRRHAAEERAHIGLWDDFAAAAGGAGEHVPLQGSSECAAAWTAGADPLEHLAVLYAVEASQPAISGTKLEGLIEHYGYAPDSPALEYFRLHRALDVRHAAEARELILALCGPDGPDAETEERMVSSAQRALEGNWHLLDSVQEAAAA